MWGVWTVGAALALLLVARGELLRCQHPQCQYLGKVGGDPLYQVDGNTIQVEVYTDLLRVTNLLVDCYGGNVLQSRALPRAESTRYVADVKLRRCPLPAGGSLVDTLAALNVALVYDERGSLWLPSGQLTFLNMLPSPPLAAQHFIGLESLVGLTIYGKNIMTLERGFLAPLRNLRSLWVVDAALPDGELDAPPPALKMLSLVNGTGVTRIPEAIRSLSTLSETIIISQNAIDAGTIPSGANEVYIKSPATTLRLDRTHVLKKLTVYSWTEPRPARLSSCDLLEWLELVTPAVEALPAGWLANCSNLTLLRIENARYLTSLPPQLFLNASALERVNLAGGVLETVPVDLLDYSPNLNSLNLASNRLRTLPSEMLIALRRLPALNVTDNPLELETARAVSAPGGAAPDLRRNPRLAPGDDSPVRNLVNLARCW